MLVYVTDEEEKKRIRALFEKNDASKKGFEGPIDMPEDFIKDITEDLYGFAKFDIPELYFDHETLDTKTYGSLTRDEVIEELDKLRDKYNKKYPGREREVYQFTNYEAKWFLPKYIERGEMPDWEKEIADDVKRVFENEECTLEIMGRYFSDKNRIVLYTRAFEKYSGDEKFAKYLNTYVHELFHALHFQLAPSTFHENTYEAEVVKEALADYYAYTVSLYLGDVFNSTEAEFAKACKKVASERKDWWEMRIFSGIPYAKAIFCEYHGRGHEKCNDFNGCEKTGAIDKLKKVLDLSKTDMHVAYEELVPEGLRQKGGSHGYYDGESFYILVDVMLGHAYYTYRFDPRSGGVATGDTVICHSSNGRDSEVVVRSVRIVYEDEYRKICKRCGVYVLSMAERA